MYSYRLNDFGSIDHLQRVEEPRPRPGRQQVLIRVAAVSLNYRDLAILHGKSTLAPQAGLIPLSDGVGYIVECGEDATRFACGDRVAGIFFPQWLGGSLTPGNSGGAWGSRADGWLTEYKVIDEASLVSVPDYLSDEQAATLPCAAVTAWNSLTQSRPLQPGETVLTQGTGGVALFAVQFARLMGLKIIALTSSEEKAALLRELGATHTVNYRLHPDWYQQARALTDGVGVQRVVEIGGPGTLQNSLKSTASGGEIALLGFVAAGDESVDFMTLFTSGATVRPFSVGSREDFERMNLALAQSRLKPVIDRVFSFSETREAWRYFDRQQHCGKVVIKMDAVRQ
ncbi:zinc-dependent alcohol dehydrogenase family protein [Erwinia sp. SLM-02]|uniref:zinc-dependent alcohol dehydrogenase family protein n=1 Tax=Erwinia sp. SLM-02 TaxID=3020057 RepID=UPI003080399B